MFSKAPRQTSFHNTNQNPGPGSYNPLDSKKSNSNAVAFNKQPERFKRDDSNLSTISNSTTSSARSGTQQMRSGKIQERLRTFELQIQERDQIISRLKMDRVAALSRYQFLVDAYKQLRRVSVQSIPSQKLPKDLSQEIMRLLIEEKQQSKEVTRPSMNEKDIKDHMSTFIVEMEQTDDPRILTLESEKNALEVSLEESKKQIEQLFEEKQNLKTELEHSVFEIGRLTGSLRASEAKDSEIKSLEHQLQLMNSLVDNMNSNVTTKDDKLFSTLRELGDAKATLASLQNTIAQQTLKLEENQNKYERSVANLKTQIESKEDNVKQLEQKLNELATSLRSSQEERERLAQELSSTVKTLEKIAQENGDFSSKSTAVEEELMQLGNKCKARKAELVEAENLLRQEKENSEQLKKLLERRKEELDELVAKHRDEEEASKQEKENLQIQLHRSHENFERQLDEIRKTNESLVAQKTELENELKLAVNRMRTLENQVQKRDELLADVQENNASLQEQLAEAVNASDDLSEQLSESADEVIRIRSQLDLVQSMEAEAKSELSEFNKRFLKLQEENEQKLEEIQCLRSEIASLDERNRELLESLRLAQNETEAERKKFDALELDTSSVKLLNLAITAELEQTKSALQNASENMETVKAVKLELEAAEAEKLALKTNAEKLEEQVESWIRVRDSLAKQLKESEDKYQEAMDNHASQMSRRENTIKMLEEHLSSVKEAHEDELNSLKKNHEQSIQQLNQSSAAHLREIQEKVSNEKSELLTSIENLKTENELLKNETESLVNSKASFSLQLQAKESEVLHLRNKAAEADFYENKCQQLEKQAVQARENIVALQDDVQAFRQELINVESSLEQAERANRAYAMFTLALVNSEAGSQKVGALQLENENLRHQLTSLNELLDTLETGIKTSEAENSVYVKSYAQMQQQIQRLVGHSNNKQRIQYVGKLQTENRELKEEQAKLRTKIDAMQKKLNQMENQLKKNKDKENQLDATTMPLLSVTQSKFY